MSRLLRLRFVHTRYPHWCARSGFTQVVRHLDPAGFRSVLDGAADSDDDVPRWLAAAKPWLRRRVARGAMPWYKLGDLMAELRALPGALAGRYHAVHFLDGEHAGQYLPRWLKRVPWPRPVTVASFHQPHTLQEQLLNPTLIGALDHVTVLSPSQVPFLARYLPRERIHLFAHGVDTAFFRPPMQRQHTDRLHCITVGHWLRDWPLMRAVAAAFRDDPRVHFHVVSSGDTGLDGLPNVTLYRGISDDELAQRYRQADALLLPLTECTANNALLEGIASGLPAVTTDLAGTRFHLAGAGAILTPPADARACVEALRALRDQPDRRAALAREARRRAEELAWPSIALRFETFYREIVTRGTRFEARLPAPGAIRRRRSSKIH
ncbi:glycosyltransferase family 4 protein [Ectothiorhodospiraceae bacterium 2226]|nr:glycosyltransferase family 4 protein [Ectothiorhodospiraceae bacterium 2226]